MTPLVAVFGKGADCPEAVARSAANVGWQLAAAGYVLLTGGLGGAMEAAASGASAVRAGLVVSLLPAGRDDVVHEYADVAIPLGLPEPFRNVVLAHACHGAVMLPGSWGTMQEATVVLDRRAPIVWAGEHDGFVTDVLTDSMPGAVDAVAAVAMLEAMLRDR